MILSRKILWALPLLFSYKDCQKRYFFASLPSIFESLS